MTSTKEIKEYIRSSNSIHTLQMIRAKANKRIKSLIQPKEKSHFSHIPIEERREVLKDLFT